MQTAVFYFMGAQGQSWRLNPCTPEGLTLCGEGLTLSGLGLALCGEGSTLSGEGFTLSGEGFTLCGGGLTPQQCPRSQGNLLSPDGLTPAGSFPLLSPPVLWLDVN